MRDSTNHTNGSHVPARRSVLRASGASLSLIRRLRPRTLTGRLQILCYHRVGRPNESDAMTMPLPLFEEQMRLLNRQYQPISLGRAVEMLRQGQALPNRAVSVTFDDGYEDTLTRAFPILQRWRIPATVFVTTGFIDGLAAPELFPQGPMLTWQMIRQLSRAGIEIGSHTLTHAKLSQLGPDQLRAQLLDSKRRLEEQLQISIDLFAYPYGDASAVHSAAHTAARDAGYQAACTTVPGSNGPETDLLALHRITPGRRDAAALALQLAELPTHYGLGGALGYGLRRKLRLCGSPVANGARS